MNLVDTQGLTRRRRLASSVVLSLLFLVLYGFCNRVTAGRSDVSAFRFGWEAGIPFLSAFILPYMSLDLFFVSAPLLTRTRDELSRLEIRVALAIILSCLGFLVWPLRCLAVKPPVTGISGWVFDHFLKMDLPFNQLPSLHIVLSVVLGAFYFARFRGVARWLSVAAFSVIALSTVVTFQHHVIDVIGGALVGLLCLSVGTRQSSRVRFSVYYGCASFVCAVIAWRYQSAWIAIAWPSAAFALVSVAYGLNATSLVQAGGVLLWPIRFGHFLSHRHYARRSAAWKVLDSKVKIGRLLNAREASALVEGGVSSVIDLSAELRGPFASSDVSYLPLPTLDLTAPTRFQIRRALDFIERAPGEVYIHCKVGYSRTAAVAGCWLLQSGAAASADEAMAMLRTAREGIVIRPEAEAAIREWVV